MSGSDDSNGAPTRLDKPERISKPKVEVDFGPRYRVLGLLGKGGMGAVFRAYDSELKCEVALKVVTGDGDAALARFRREIALARKVTNPNVLRVYDLGEYEGQRFLSMELVDGEDLAALMKREGRLPLPRALALFRQVCQGSPPRTSKASCIAISSRKMSSSTATTRCASLTSGSHARSVTPA